MKILFVTTISNTVNAFLIPHIRTLVEDGHKVDLAFNLVHEVSQELLDLGCEVHNMPFQRSPLAKKNRTAYRELKKLVEGGGYGLVHTHTPIASFLTRMACRNIGGLKVIYTAHGFHFHKNAPLKNWIIYYTAEYLASRYTDLIITINREDYVRAKNLLKAKSVEYVPGVGLDLKKYTGLSISRSEKLSSIGANEGSFVVLSVGELNFNKNHETVIRAISKLKDPSIQYLICGEGPLKEELKKLIVELGLERQVKLLGERRDLPEIYSVSDIMVFPSRREGLGMASLEAMASGLPIITSNVHGIVDYSVDGITGFLCNPTDVGGFVRAIARLKSEPELRAKMGEHNKEAVKMFELQNILGRMTSIYKDVISTVESDGR